MTSLTTQAQREAIKQVQTEKPEQFTVGAYLASDGTMRAAITYDRKLSNLWGLTAYAKAYWHDLSVTAHPKLDAGVELTRKF